MLYYILNNIYNNQSNIITEKHINNILLMIDNNKPNITLDLPKQKRIIKEYNKLYITDKKDIIENYKIEFKDNLIFENLIFEKKDNENLDDNSICRLDSNNIKLPLYIRNKKDGDYIILKNSNHRKKVKEIFIEKKVPSKLRKTYPLLVDSDDNIIWIPNLKKSKFCIKKEEKYDIIIRCNEREEDYESEKY